MRNHCNITLTIQLIKAETSDQVTLRVLATDSMREESPVLFEKEVNFPASVIPEEIETLNEQLENALEPLSKEIFFIAKAHQERESKKPVLLYDSMTNGGDNGQQA